MWPQATHLLCQWHCLQAVWRWLWNGSHNIVKADRQVLMRLFRKLVYSKSREDFDIAEKEFLENEVCNKYPQFISHINRTYMPRKEKFAMYIRNLLQLPTHSVNTSNFVESSFRILKDFVFNRTKVNIARVYVKWSKISEILYFKA